MEKLQISPELLSVPDWSQKESNNVQIMAAFIQGLMNDHDFETIRTKFHDYGVQHNRGIPDGIDGLVNYVEAFAKRFPEYGYDVKRVIANGDYVVFHSHVTIKKSHRGNDKKGLNIIDTWKLEDGKIVAHWDAIQPLDLFMRCYVLFVGGQIKNTNGVF